jgi:hypothetical protein
MHWRNKFAFCISMMVGLTMLVGSTAYAQLPTIDEALDISKKTGAPIFAMAGRES